MSYASSEGSSRKPSNGSAVLEIRKPEPQSPAPVQAPVLEPRFDAGVFTRLEGVEPAAAVAPLPEAPGEPTALPAPARPLNGPLILGVLAFVPGLLLPLTLAFESTRVLGILGFCLSGFFVPFAPIAWMAGLNAEKRRRDQGLRPERRASVGRRLGQAATLVLVAEITLALVGIAVLRLSGSFPSTFWAYF